MANGVNKVILIGNIGADPEVRYTPAGDAVCNVNLATTSSWKDKQSGERKEKTEWHRLLFFTRLAEIMGEYARKGSKIYVEGSLQTTKYEKDGQTHYSTQVKVSDMQLLDSKGSSQSGSMGAGSHQQPQQPQHQPQGNQPQWDDDIPF